MTAKVKEAFLYSRFFDFQYISPDFDQRRLSVI